MGLFGKKKVVDEKSSRLNQVLIMSLEIEENKIDLTELPENINEDIKKVINDLKFYVFEYIKQLKEAVVFSKGAVKKFILNDYSWVSKENIDKLIEIGLNRL